MRSRKPVDEPGVGMENEPYSVPVFLALLVAAGLVYGADALSRGWRALAGRR